MIITVDVPVIEWGGKKFGAKFVSGVGLAIVAGDERVCLPAFSLATLVDCIMWLDRRGLPHPGALAVVHNAVGLVEDVDLSGEESS